MFNLQSSLNYRLSFLSSAKLLTKASSPRMQKLLFNMYVSCYVEKYSEIYLCNVLTCRVWQVPVAAGVNPHAYTVDRVRLRLAGKSHLLLP